MALSRAEKIANYAFYSRILVLLLQAVFNFLMPDHDAQVFNPPSPYTRNKVDTAVELMLDGFRRWDGIYFMHIAEHGYTYENTLAFFPLYPFSIRVLANTALYPLQYIMSYFSTLLVAGFLINLYCFVQTARVLYELSKNVLKDETLAFKSAQLFCINPACIFFSAFYSEASFAFIVFSGMLQMEQMKTLKSSVTFGFSALCRSNGLINIGFPLYYYVKQYINQLLAIRKQKFDVASATVAIVSSSYLTILPCLFSIIVCFIPFLLYQYYASTIFCNDSASYKDLQSHILNYGNERKYKMAYTGPSEWCDASVFPFSYSYVQVNHWDQGFMKYYELKQIPNFLLAAPMIVLCLAAIFSYVRNNLNFCITIGLLKEDVKEDSKKNDDMTAAAVSRDYSFHSRKVFVYVVQLMFLVMFGVFFMHIQVITRFICCASPVVYWYIAYLTTPEDLLCPAEQHNRFNIFVSTASARSTTTAAAASSVRNKPISRTNSDISNPDDVIDWENQSWSNKLIFVYFHLYFFVGIGAFSNFLPWT